MRSPDTSHLPQEHRPDVEVSVVMSVYNGAPQLQETIDSILGQEGVAFEFIIVDDGSTDETPQILEEYGRRDARIRVIHQENQGLTKALIRGCAEAQGKYIARQDVGDLSLPERLYMQKKAFEKDEHLAFLSCWTAFYGPQWEFLYLIKGRGQAKSPSHIISETESHGVVDGPTSHPSVMFRKDFYMQAGGYRAQFYYGQDWDLWYRLAELGKFQVIQQTLYKVRVLPGGVSMSNKTRQTLISRLSLAALRQRRLNLSEGHILERASVIRPITSERSKTGGRAPGLYFIGECLRRNGDSRSLHYFRTSIKESPLSIKSWIRFLQAKIRFTSAS